MPDSSDLDRDLKQLEVELRLLESEYNMYFSGRLPRPPWETRSRVEALVKRCDRARSQNTAERFRLSTLQNRFSTFVELWDRALRAREEGRPGPFGARQPAPEAPEPALRDSFRIVHVVSFRDPDGEADKLRELYERLADARRETGEPAVPFGRFVRLVESQVAEMRDRGSPEVAFRVAVKDGRVSFTARGLKGVSEE